MDSNVVWLDSQLLLNQVVPVYQPIIELETSRVVAFEALARWVHGGGAVSPEVFIPAARKAGLLDDLTLVICQYVSRNIDLLGAISINLELVQLGNPVLIEDICQVFGEQGLKRLHIEITEVGAVDVDFALARAGMERFKSLGVGFSLDDFGNGLSNFQRLCELPVDTLKIPRNLIVGMTTQMQSQACVDATLNLAQVLGLKTIAEGVECVFQRNALKKMGCTMVQGNWYSRPLDAQCAADYKQKRLGLG
ncbi:EAL domain-containing protein [Pseudomonas sp. M30-35]|uniref:EAL domain-containing protein n=1 Tax=Pseudomonas sp. M30-35 TaxID=1981174 RepID=UPI000B3CDB64|nr:EAL domain-containing protein [Pseudomonas sp. M30-35]ARU88914.1 hypothetical protein B9K09_13475 [Pseudomonas sp. M30-35]